MRRLPPLGAIEAFVQVARLGSIKAAAEELALSAPALSRRVQSFERFINRPLFARRHQAMVLNEVGEQLLEKIAPVLDQLSDAVEEMSAGTELLRLRLGVLPLFAAQRLFPRLGALRQAHPELHLDIDTAGHGVARLGDGLDAVVALARDIDPALYSRLLDTNSVYVIGARTLLDGQRPLTRPEQLSTMTALLHREMPDTMGAWSQAAGLGTFKPLAVDFFDSGGLMLEAAAQGLGIAFMHASHFNHANDPRLVRLFPEIEVTSPYSHWFVCRPRAMQTKPVRIFHDWLFANLKE